MKLFIITMAIALGSLFVNAQEKQLTLEEKQKMATFAGGYTSFSYEKPAYITFKDGKEIEAKIRGLDRKKGQIRGIKILDKEGNKTKIPASDIKTLYMAPSGLEKLGHLNDYLSDMKQWSRKDVNDVTNKGYTLYKNELVSLKNKKKEAEYLIQVVNPSYSKHIEIFNDPFAKETASVGFGGIKLAGGIAKSYYLKKGDNKIIWLHKSDFKDEFEKIFFDNEKFKKEYKDKKIKWRLLGVYVLDYTRFSKK